MNEIRLALSGEALRALAQGIELLLDIDDTRIHLACDEDAVNEFQRAVQRAMLHFLLAGEQKH